MGSCQGQATRSELAGPRPQQFNRCLQRISACDVRPCRFVTRSVAVLTRPPSIEERPHAARLDIMSTFALSVVIPRI